MATSVSFYILSKKMFSLSNQKYHKKNKKNKIPIRTTSTIIQTRHRHKSIQREQPNSIITTALLTQWKYNAIPAKKLSYQCIYHVDVLVFVRPALKRTNFAATKATNIAKYLSAEWKNINSMISLVNDNKIYELYYWNNLQIKIIIK